MLDQIFEYFEWIENVVPNDMAFIVLRKKKKTENKKNFFNVSISLKMASIYKRHTT